MPLCYMSVREAAVENRDENWAGLIEIKSVGKDEYYLFTFISDIFDTGRLSRRCSALSPSTTQNTLGLS